jgi:serine/threonine protein kinase
MHFRYDVFFSPRPATFVRETTQGTNIPTNSQNCLVVVFDSELEPGSTGIVHTGTMDVTPSKEKIPIAVKLAFSDDDKLTLKHEYTIYSHLQSENVPGIPQVFGLFVDAELIYGNEGPYALIMSFAGPALYSLPKDIPTITKLAHFAWQRYDADCDSRRSLVTTLQKIHEAGVIHGDLSSANICINDTRGFIIDFTHARLRGHPRAQAAEMEELHTLLKLETSVISTKRKIAEVDATNLRRSTRLRDRVQDSELAKRHKIEAGVFPAEVAPANQATLKTVTARKPAAIKAAMTSPATKKSAAKKTPVKRASAKTTPAKKTAAKRATARQVTAIKSTTTRPTAKTSAAKRTPAKRTPAKGTPPKTPAETSRTRSGRSSRPTRM